MNNGRRGPVIQTSCYSGYIVWVWGLNFSSLEIFKTCLDVVLCSLLWMTLLRQGVGLDDPQRSLPTPMILWFCD